jgi:hypothetical protein
MAVGRLQGARSTPVGRCLGTIRRPRLHVEHVCLQPLVFLELAETRRLAVGEILAPTSDLGVSRLLAMFAPIVHDQAMRRIRVEPARRHERGDELVGFPIRAEPIRDVLVGQPTHVAARSMLGCEMEQQLDEPNRGALLDCKRAREPSHLRMIGCGALH